MAYNQILEDDTGSEHIIEIKDLCKSFDGTKVLKNITFYIRNNEFITLLGPSGCGKSTTLRIIAGFETADSGIVNFEGKDLKSVPANKRNINTVFQRYALFPHLNVFDNVAFGLKIKKVNKAEIKQRVNKALATVGLADYGERYIDQLSGGQMQRELGITFVYVTHDQEEALTMSDTIIVMKDGVIQQIGTPIDVYNEPKNAYVADFIGESNIVAGTMKKDKEVVLSSGITFECVDPMFPEFTEGIANLVDVVIRPEDFYVAEEKEGRINGTVESLVFKGVHYEMIVKSDDGIEWLVQNVDPSAVGSRVGLYVDPDDIQIMRRSELSPDFGSFGIKHPEARDNENREDVVSDNVVEEADNKPEDKDGEPEVETGVND